MHRSPMRRSRQRINPVSATTLARREERRAVVAATHARDGRCVAIGLIPNHVCGGPMDCHEVQARGTMPGSQYDGTLTASICRRGHDWIEAHIPEAEALGLRKRSTFELDGRARAMRL